MSQVTTKAALDSAEAWIAQLCKKFGIKKTGLKRNDTTVDFVIYFGANALAGNSQRLNKMQNLVSFVRRGHADSKEWTRKDDVSSYDREVFISADGRFKLAAYDTYNGAGGWKVATKTVGIRITDIQPVN